MKRIAIFASGSGTNAESIVRYFNDSETAQVILILTDNKDAYVLERAIRLGIPSHFFTVNELKEGDVKNVLSSNSVDFIVLAGFLKLIPYDIIKMYPNRIINIHPALLPKYGGRGMYGMRVHRAVKEAGESKTGISIHYVNEHYDEGSIIFQAICPVSPSDKPETIAERVHSLEYEYYPIVIERIVGAIE